MNEYISQDEINRRLGIKIKNPIPDQIGDKKAIVIKSDTSGNSPLVSNEVLGNEIMLGDKTINKILGDLHGDQKTSYAALKETEDRVVAKQGRETDLETQLVKVKEEKDAAIVKIKDLEDRRIQETKIAEIQAKKLNIDRDAAINETKAIKADLEQCKTELRKAEDTLEAYTCPECGTFGWGIEIRQLTENAFKRKIGKPYDFLVDFFGLDSDRIVRFKDCPNLKCGNVKEVEQK